MAFEQRRAGTLVVMFNGELQEAAGDFEYSLGGVMRTELTGPGGLTGYKEEHIAPYISGDIRDRKTLDLAKIRDMENAVIHLVLAVGKTVVLKDAFQSGPLNGNSGEGKIPVKFVGFSAEEVN
jgi:hypothetical protein